MPKSRKETIKHADARGGGGGGGGWGGSMNKMTLPLPKTGHLNISSYTIQKFGFI